MDILEEDVIAILSTKFNDKKRKIIKRPRTLDSYKRKQKKRGDVILLNSQESKKTKFRPLDENFFEINEFALFSTLNPRKLNITESHNFFAWIMSHFVYRSEFQDKDTPELLKEHTTATKMVTSSYWIYRIHTMYSKEVSFNKKDEQSLLSGYAIYNKADESYLNTTFPEAAPFPTCRENYEIYNKEDFFKSVVYPMYFLLTKDLPFVETLRTKLNTKKDVYLASNFFPTIQEMKRSYFLVLHSSVKLQKNQFVVDHTSISKAIRCFFDIDLLFLFLFTSVVLEINKEWI